MSQPNDPNQPQTFPLRHRIFGRMPSVYAHNVLIQTLPDEVVVSFFETILPPKSEVTPEDVEELKETGLIAECVARITLSHRQFLDIADAMHRTAEKLREKRDAQTEGSKTQN